MAENHLFGVLVELAQGDESATLLHNLCPRNREALGVGKDAGFLLLNQEHRLEVAFERSAWDDHAVTVERVLGLPPGAAGRDRA